MAAAAGSSRIPALGRTRCYWAVLEGSTLNYVFLDPILFDHLGDEAAGFLQHSLLDFVHPTDAEIMHRDLIGEGVRDIFGSVTSAFLLFSTLAVHD